MNADKRNHWLGRLLCALGIHNRRTIELIGTELFCIVEIAECKRCKRVQRWNGLEWETVKGFRVNPCSSVVKKGDAP